jgi:hypothetical protein
MQVGDHARLGPAIGNVPSVGSFNLVAHAQAPGAQHTSVVVDAEPLVGNVNVALGIEILATHVVHADRDRKVLKLAVAVCHANGADMVPLGEEQFDNHQPILSQAFGVGPDYHSLGHRRDAGRMQFVAAGDFDETHTARTD